MYVVYKYNLLLLLESAFLGISESIPVYFKIEFRLSQY